MIKKPKDTLVERIMSERSMTLMNNLSFNLCVALKGYKRELHTGTNKIMMCQLSIAY